MFVCGHLLGKAYLLALLFVMFSRAFICFPYGVPGQVWYMIVLITDLCLLPYFEIFTTSTTSYQRSANAVKAQCKHKERSESVARVQKVANENSVGTG